MLAAQALFLTPSIANEILEKYQLTRLFQLFLRALPPVFKLSPTLVLSGTGELVRISISPRLSCREPLLLTVKLKGSTAVWKVAWARVSSPAWARIELRRSRRLATEPAAPCCCISYRVGFHHVTSYGRTNTPLCSCYKSSICSLGASLVTRLTCGVTPTAAASG